MHDFWTSVVGLLTKAPRYFFAIFVVSFALLIPFHDDPSHFGIAQLPGSWRPVLVVVLGLSFAFWSVQAVPWLRRVRQQRLERQALEDSLTGLCQNEKIVLAYCYWKKQRTVTMKALHPTAVSLTSKGVFRRPSVSSDADRCPLTMTPLVWKRLCKQPGRLLPPEFLKSEFKQAVFSAFQEILDDEPRYRF
jgi:hypothetical protein